MSAVPLVVGCSIAQLKSCSSSSAGSYCSSPPPPQPKKVNLNRGGSDCHHLTEVLEFGSLSIKLFKEAQVKTCPFFTLIEGDRVN